MVVLKAAGTRDRMCGVASFCQFRHHVWKASLDVGPVGSYAGRVKDSRTRHTLLPAACGSAREQVAGPGVARESAGSKLDRILDARGHGV